MVTAMTKEIFVSFMFYDKQQKNKISCYYFQTHFLDRDSAELNASAASDWDFILTKILNIVDQDQNGRMQPLYTLEVSENNFYLMIFIFCEFWCCKNKAVVPTITEQLHCRKKGLDPGQVLLGGDWAVVLPTQ